MAATLVHLYLRVKACLNSDSFIWVEQIVNRAICLKAPVETLPIELYIIYSLHLFQI